MAAVVVYEELLKYSQYQTKAKTSEDTCIWKVLPV